jgi:hypothetical protein
MDLTTTNMPPTKTARVEGNRTAQVDGDGRRDSNNDRIPCMSGLLCQESMLEV